jgi:hypothetical protein
MRHKQRNKHLTLYHFTCSHSKQGIERTGTLIPNLHPFMPNLGPLIWLTDQPEPPSRESVGLTSKITSCDRMQYRYTVRSSASVSWAEIRGKAPAEVVASLESFGQPEHWYVARRTLTASEFFFDAAYKHEETVQP